MGYSTREAADLLGLPVSRIRAWAREGLLEPERHEGGPWEFTFRDVVLLRTARDLLDADVPARRIRRALLDLRRSLPDGRPLSAVRLSSRGAAVVVTDEDGTWEPASGQLHLDFSPAETPAAALPRTLPGPGDHAGTGRTADEWYDVGLELEPADGAGAEAAYRRALELDPGHADAHLNLGRLLHEGGALAEAEKHYRSALAADPESARALYNLGVALEDGGRRPGAVEAYQAALRLDPDLAVAHFNLSRLLERMGRPAEALGHLAEYKRLLDGAGRNA